MSEKRTDGLRERIADQLEKAKDAVLRAEDAYDAGDKGAAVGEALYRIDAALAALLQEGAEPVGEVVISAGASNATSGNHVPPVPEGETVEAKCAHCGNPAACLGRYEGHGPVAYACSVCCGHGNEDGWCWQLDEIPAEVHRLLITEGGDTDG